MSQNIKRAILGVLHASCVLVFVTSSAPVSAGEMRRVVSDYAVTPETGHGVIRAFFYGPNTVIEFQNPPSSFSVVDEQGKPVEFEPEGRFIRLIGRPSVFTAMFSGKAATFRTFVHVAKVPKPTVDELTQFDNFYADKGKPLDMRPVNPAPPQQLRQGQTGQPSAQAAVPSVGSAATPTAQSMPEAKEEEKIISVVKTSPNKQGNRAPANYKELVVSSVSSVKPANSASSPNADPRQAVISEVKESPTEMLMPGRELKTPRDTTEVWALKREDRTIRETLERWGKAAGWEVSWEVPRKIPASFEATFAGPFDVAVDKLMDALRGSDYPLIGCLYEDNKVVRILRRGEVKKCHE